VGIFLESDVMGYHDRHPAASVEDPLLVIIGFAVAGAALAAITYFIAVL
jgi:hypothetical protein